MLTRQKSAKSHHKSQSSCCGCHFYAFPFIICVSVALALRNFSAALEYDFFPHYAQLVFICHRAQSSKSWKFGCLKAD